MTDEAESVPRLTDEKPSGPRPDDPESGSAVDEPDPPPPPPRRAGGATPALAAAMLAMGEIIEPEKTRAEIVQTDDRPEDDDDGLDLDFGDLPPV